MFRSSYKIATVWGIPIRIHVSLLLIVFFLVRRFGLIHGVLLELCVMTSIVMHELGHSLVAIWKGCRVNEITLLFLGGAAQMENMPTRPRDEFLMAVAGPLVSLILGVVCIYGGKYLPLPPMHDRLQGGYYPFNLFEFVGLINVVLLVFNLLPSFPMDGGRVVRAALTPKFGRLKATFIAARLGKIMAILFAVHGIMTGNWLLVFIAFFVFTTAGNEYRMVQMQESIKYGNFRFDTWSAFEPKRETPGNHDQVTISPPPYKRGPDSKTGVHVEDDTFHNFFGQ
ncbi:MAG: site-2 protease family protein [Lentisphaerae bacterium]|nr:site-2 protease family protein [Lentisphaerota bacterium]